LATTKKRGDWGEKQAVAYLKENNYEILATNWRYKKLEVDIIAKIAETIAFVEVKTRGSDEFGEPETFVSLKKQRFIIEAANHYILEKDLNTDARFDIISVLQNNNITRLKHFPDAFYPKVK
jgi:putative endonuclease